MDPLAPIPDRSSSSAEEVEAIRAAARGIEALLVRQMLDAMRRAQLEDEGFFGGGAGAGVRQTQFDLLLADLLAEREPFGLAEAITRELTGSSPAPRPADSAARGR